MSLPQLNLVDTEVRIAGEIADFETLTLRQTMCGHHRFEIRVNYRPNKPSVWTVMPENIFEQLGESLTIKFTHKESGELTDFEGFITDIDVEGRNGDQGVVVLRGGSPTLLLDMDASMGSFVDYTLGNIVSEVIENSGVRMEVSNNPQFTTIIPYAVRYKETSFAFMERLAASCGDWFYYDGKKLVLGNPRIENDTRAAFDMELTNIKISARVGNLNSEMFDYDGVYNDYKFDFSGQNIDGVNSYMRVAKDRSESFFPNPTRLPANRFMVHGDDMITQMRARYSRDYTSMSEFTADTNTCVIRIGELVTTRLPESLQKDVGPDLGRYRVIEMTHTVNEEGVYSNTFKGLVGMVESLPVDHIVQPTAFPEPATVVENQDPETQGRVKVRFFWMPEGVSSNWLRVQAHNRGVSENSENMHGFMFVPAVDDQVMVAFEKGDPSRPYVTGSLFHGDNSAGAMPDNVISKIVSVSGHTIELNDTEGEEKINIYDNEGSLISFDTQAKSLSIISAENIEISAKNIKITADENINLEAKSNVLIAAEADLNAQAQGNVAIQSDGDTTVSSGGVLAMEATSDATISGANAIVEGTASAELNAAKTKVTGSAMSEFSGAIVKIN